VPVISKNAKLNTEAAREEEAIRKKAEAPPPNLEPLLVLNTR
jgi:hypothetical protein